MLQKCFCCTNTLQREQIVPYSNHSEKETILESLFSCIQDLRGLTVRLRWTSVSARRVWTRENATTKSAVLSASAQQVCFTYFLKNDNFFFFLF